MMNKKQQKRLENWKKSTGNTPITEPKGFGHKPEKGTMRIIYKDDFVTEENAKLWSDFIEKNADHGIIFNGVDFYFVEIEIEKKKLKCIAYPSIGDNREIFCGMTWLADESDPSESEKMKRLVKKIENDVRKQVSLEYKKLIKKRRYSFS